MEENGNLNEKLLDSRPSRSRQRKWSVRGSWRSTVWLGAFLASLVLVINASVLAWVYAKYEVEGGIATIFEGSCSVTKNTSTYTHLVINILGTILLSASNNCSQLLSSPTRKDIEKAHAKGKWLDVGVPSVRNLRSIPWTRTCLWMMLLMSSLPLHLLYNSVILENTTLRKFEATLVTSNVVSGNITNQIEPTLLHEITGDDLVALGLQNSTEGLQRLENAECIKQFGYGVSNPTRGNVVAVTKHAHNQSVISTWVQMWPDLDWVCNGDVSVSELYPDTHTSIDEVKCDVSTILAKPEKWTLPMIGNCQDPSSPACMSENVEVHKADGTLVYNETGPVYRHGNFSDSDDYSHCLSTGCCQLLHAPVEYCLTKPSLPRCTLNMSTTILAIVVACNAVKVFAMVITARSTYEPLATVGDVVSSFLEFPDSSTAGQGPVSSLEVKELSRPWCMSCLKCGDSSTPRRYKVRIIRWKHAVSAIRWYMCLILCILAIATSIFALFMGMSSSKDTGIALFAQMGTVGEALSSNNIVGHGRNLSLLENVLITNSPQLIVSLIYLLYNSVLTSMLMSAEYALYATRRRPLRVSRPSGMQRSTLWLQLPYKYILPILVAMALLHWLIFKSLFLMPVAIYKPDGTWLNSIHSIGYSPLAMLLAIILGGILVLGLIVLSMRKLDRGMPMASSCSLAISAACANNVEVGASKKPLQYGVLKRRPDAEGRQYVGFSAEEVTPLQPGVEYL